MSAASVPARVAGRSPRRLRADPAALAQPGARCCSARRRGRRRPICSAIWSSASCWFAVTLTLRPGRRACCRSSGSGCRCCSSRSRSCASLADGRAGPGRGWSACTCAGPTGGRVGPGCAARCVLARRRSGALARRRSRWSCCGPWLFVARPGRRCSPGSFRCSWSACRSGTATCRNNFDNGTSAHGIALGYFPDGPHGATHYGWFIGDTPVGAGRRRRSGWCCWCGRQLRGGRRRPDARPRHRGAGWRRGRRPSAVHGWDPAAAVGGRRWHSARSARCGQWRPAVGGWGRSGWFRPALNCEPTLRRCAAGPASRFAAFSRPRSTPRWTLSRNSSRCWGSSSLFLRSFQFGSLTMCSSLHVRPPRDSIAKRATGGTRAAPRPDVGPWMP